VGHKAAQEGTIIIQFPVCIDEAATQQSANCAPVPPINRDESDAPGARRTAMDAGYVSGSARPFPDADFSKA
jgi:hypothetical protein